MLHKTYVGNVDNWDFEDIDSTVENFRLREAMRHALLLFISVSIGVSISVSDSLKQSNK